MSRKKVLFVTEASFHPTGYSVYTKEVLSRLSRHPELEVAELGCYATSESEEIKSLTWKFYPNVPLPSDEEATNIYNSSMSNKFGEFALNNVLIDFQPDFVMDIRDWWMLEFEERSPFRNFFNWAIMPTVDAEPQNQTWMDTYSDADGLFAYSEFGRDTMKKQAKNLNFVDVASPCASDTFYPIEDKVKFREEMGIDQDAIIFGTVMRNQRRKLYPDLFKAFKLFLDQNPNMNNVYLYCHTGYPDVGWDIPDLIKDNGLSNRVLFTYKCKKCGKIKPMFFNDALAFCNDCQMFASTLVGISNKMDDTDLNKVYNIFDVYIQWANSEGWGMPQLEAAYAGAPVISVHYSAMESLIDNIKGIGIKPIGFYKELETGCNRAVPDNQGLADTIKNLAYDSTKRKYAATKCHENAKKIYNWDYTATKWLKYFLSTPTKDPKQTWYSPSRVFNPATQVPNDILNMPAVEQVNWLFINVLGRVDLLNKSMWKRMVKDLSHRISMTSMVPGYYYNDFTHPDMERRAEDFDFNKAYQMCQQITHNFNQWEQLRIERLGVK
jgi:glycosyltransferase involved in cell wall biosynthesis